MGDRSAWVQFPLSGSTRGLRSTSDLVDLEREKSLGRLCKARRLNPTTRSEMFVQLLKLPNELVRRPHAIVPRRTIRCPKLVSDSGSQRVSDAVRSVQHLVEKCNLRVQALMRHGRQEVTAAITRRQYSEVLVDPEQILDCKKPVLPLDVETLASMYAFRSASSPLKRCGVNASSAPRISS